MGFKHAVHGFNGSSILIKTLKVNNEKSGPPALMQEQNGE